MEQDHITQQLTCLDAIYEEIKSTKTHLKELESKLEQGVYSAISSSPTTDEWAQIGAELYWNREYVKPSWVYGAMGLTTYNLLDYIPPAYINVHCFKCGKEIEIKLTSRQQLKDLRSAERKGSSWSRSICPDCEAQRAKENEKYREEYHQRNERHKAYIRYLQQLPYAEYLKTDHWKEMRQRELKRAGFRCQVCNISRVQLHVHHRTYENRGNEQRGDLIVLCADCHETFHKSGKLQS